MNSGISGFLTGPCQGPFPMAPKRRLGHFTPNLKLERWASKPTPEAVFAELLPNHDHSVNRKNSKIVAAHLGLFLNKFEKKLDCTSIDSLRTFKRLLSLISPEQSSQELNSILDKIDQLATKLILQPLLPEIWGIVDSYDRGSIAQMASLPDNLTRDNVQKMTQDDINQLAIEYWHIGELNQFYMDRMKSFFDLASSEPEKIHLFFHTFSNLITKELSAKKAESDKAIKEGNIPLKKDISHIEQAREKFSKLLTALPKTLEILDLSNCKLSYNDSLLPIENLPRLKILNISNCELGPSNITSLVERLSKHCRWIQELDLSGNKIIDNCPMDYSCSADYLIRSYTRNMLSKKTLPRIKKLVVKDCCLSDEYRALISKSFPGVTILFDDVQMDDEKKLE